MKPKRTWIVVADGARARVLAKDSGSGVYAEVADLVADKRPTGEINADRPGRSFNSTGALRHAMEPPSDPHREEKRRLAERLGAFLDEKRSADAFDRLVIVAAPQTLGDLRAALPPAARELVIEEIDKDITKVALADMKETLDKLIAAVI